MNRQKACLITKELSIKAHYFVAKTLSCGCTLAEKLHELTHARYVLADLATMFLESNTHHDHSELFLPITQAMQQVHLATIIPEQIFYHAQEGKRVLEELSRLCSTLYSFDVDAKGVQS